MKTRMLLAPLAGALLLLGACNSDNKPVETTAEDHTASGDTAIVMNDSPDPEAMYRARGRRIADRVYTDLKLQDTAVRSRLATTYYSRAKRYGTLRSQYQTDTTGQYQAMRQAEMESDKEIQTVLTSPDMYKAYETHRADYSDDKYMDDASMGTTGSDGSMNGSTMDAGSGTSTDGSAGTMSGSANAAMSAGDAASGDKAKVKLKGEDGSKIKMKKGDVKVKDADGTKTKMNGD